MTKENLLKRVYNFYSNDLTSGEIERLILKETPIRYKYYLRSMNKPAERKNKFIEILAFVRNFAIAFLRKLSPVIRIIYTITIFLFILAFINSNWDWAILSFIILNLIMIFEIADQLTARDELEVARDVQTSLIPLQPPKDDNFDIISHYETAREVGGDFIDFIIKPDGTYFVSIGDISGKGMSAALYMVQVKLLLRYLTDCFQDPKSIIQSLNQNIFKHVRKSLYFSVTLAEIKDKTLKICRAGHTPLLYYSAVNRTCREIKQKGMALGLNNGNLFENSLDEYELTANTDDIFLFYSDGLTETMNFNKSEFGIDKVKEILINNSHKSAEEIKQDLLTEISKFRGYAEVHDDMTMIILKAK